MPTRFFELSILTSILVGCAGRMVARAAPSTEPATTQPVAAEPVAVEPVAAVWYEHSWPQPGEEMNRLIVGVWSDGTVVWSENSKTGGKPYRTAKVEPERVSKLLRELDQADLFSKVRQVNFGPDGSHTVIAAESGNKKQWLGSWHDPATTNPNVVVDERGISVVEPGQPRHEPSAEYKKFLSVWSASRKLIEEVVPQAGDPIGTADPKVYRLGR